MRRSWYYTLLEVTKFEERLHVSQSLSFSLAAALFVCAAATSASTAFAGEKEVQTALALIESNQARARKIAELHLKAIADTRLDLVAGVPTTYEPGGREAELFMNEGGEMTRRAVAQLNVARKILKAEAAAADPELTSGATLVGKIATAHEEYLAKAVESAAQHLSFEKMSQELHALDDIYKALLAVAPPWTTALKGKSGTQYEAEIAAKAALVTLDTKPGRSGPTRLPGTLDANVMSEEEYRSRKQALEDRKAADKRHYDKRMAELAEHEKAKAAEQARLERERLAALPTAPAPPPELPAMQAWHKSFYSTQILPFKQALGGVLRLPEGSRPSEACAQLTVATRTLLSDRRLASGTPAVDEALRAALQSFSQAGQACREGRMADLKTGLKAGEAGLGRFAATLATYQLQP